MMTCKAARALTVRGLSEGGESDASAHAMGCRACSAFARDVTRIWGWLGEAGGPVTHASRAGRKAGLIGLAMAAAALLAVVAAVLLPAAMRGGSPAQEPEHGIELTWRALFPADFKGSRREVTARAAQVMELRLKKRDIAGTAKPEGDDAIVVRLPGTDGMEVTDVKALLGRAGHVQVRPIADQQTYDRVQRGKPVPDGYEELLDAGDKQYFGRLPVHCLVRKEPVVTNEDIVSAVEVASGRVIPGFLVRIEFTKAGAAALDVAASELFGRQGRLGIVIDGKLAVAPHVNAEKLGGRLEVWDPQPIAGREWARNLVTTLSMPPLPVGVGSVVDGKPAPGVPESERRY